MNRARAASRRPPASAFDFLRSPFVASIFFVLVAGLSLVCSGCREKEPQFEVVTIEGKIEKIERTLDGLGTITLLYYSEKHKQDITGTGLVTRDTEIMINGAIAKLEDLREGDHVRGQVRIEKKQSGSKPIALKIVVDRLPPDGGA